MPTLSQIPFVEYLVLGGGEPHLELTSAPAAVPAFSTVANAGAGCFNAEFTTVKIPTEGEVRAFTIVSFAVPGCRCAVRRGDRRLWGHERALQRDRLPARP